MGKLRLQSGLPNPLCAALLCGLLVLPAPRIARAMSMHPHRSNHQEQQQVLHVDDQMRSALLAGDTAALDRILAEDFLGIASNGTLSDKPQYLRRIGKREHQFSRIDIVDRKVRVQSSSAVVVTKAEVRGKLDTSPVNGTYRYTRVYSRSADGSWKLRNFEATRVAGMDPDEMRNGVPINKVR